MAHLSKKPESGMTCEQAQLLMIPAWVEDPELTQQQRDAFEAHVAACPACCKEYEETQWLISTLRKHRPVAENAKEILPLSAVSVDALSCDLDWRPMTDAEGWEDLKRRCPSLAEACRRQQQEDPPADAELLRSAAEGDRQAFEILYLRHRQDLLSYISKRYQWLDEHAADDIAGEAFLRIWRDCDRLGYVRSLPAYLKIIAKNIVARRFRARRPGEVELGSCVAAPGPSPGETSEWDEVSRQVAQAVKSLAKSHRLALESSQTGLSAKQIAAGIGCTENAARRLVQKARKHLAHVLSRCGDSCVMNTDRQEQCPAFVKDFYCLKWLYVKSLRPK